MFFPFFFGSRHSKQQLPSPPLRAMAELEEEEVAVAAPEPEEEVTDLNGAVRGVMLGTKQQQKNTCGMAWEKM